MRNDMEPSSAVRPLLLAPLRGVTIRCFRETFAPEIAEAGFTEAVTPFITANLGVDPLKDREIRDSVGRGNEPVRVTPQFIGKDPEALRACLERIKAAGFETADLNCGCPFPMVRNKGRGSGLLRTPGVLARMLEVGCSVLGEGRFSIKARLGVETTDELLKLMPLVNSFPLRYLVLHARTAQQMYEGPSDWTAGVRVIDAARVPIVVNGDLSCAGELPPWLGAGVVGSMVGRSFIRGLGARDDARELALRYVAASQSELRSDRPVLGRLKELLSYWKDLPRWTRRWNLIKICRSLDELRAAI